MMKRLFASGLALTLILLIPGPGLAAVAGQVVTSPGGITAWLVEDRTNPMLSVQLAFRGGTQLDPDGKQGLARMAMGLLDEGAGDLDARAFATRLEDLAVSLSFDAGGESLSASLRTLTETRDDAFALLRLALTKPRFDDEPVARVRNQLEVMLKRDEEEPDDVASEALFAGLFPGHAYGRSSRGTLEGVAAITLGDLKTFAATRFARDNLVIGVVGDIGADELAGLLDRTFADLPAKAAPWVLPKVAAKSTGLKVIERAVPQSAITFAAPGVTRHHADFFPLYVLNHMLGGGGFTSRLYDEVREKRGLAYSVGTYLYTLDKAGLLLGNTGTRNESVAETLAVIRDVWTRSHDKGFSQAELDDAKTYLTGSYPLRFSSSGAIAGILVGLQLDGIGLDYLDKRNSYIDAVTLADVNRVAKKYLDPTKLSLVVVGQPEGLPATR